METHPPHLHHNSGKKFSHYFYEFLMLFLAVFCGFLAENLREEHVEHQKEVEYIKSMIEDLKKDTTNIGEIATKFEKLSFNFDTVLTKFDEGITAFSQSWSNNFVRIVKGGYPDYYFTDRTLQQLKNSGGMRLLKNQVVSNALVDYDDANKDFIVEDHYLSIIQQQVVDAAFKMWSFKMMEQKLKSFEWRKKNVPEAKYWVINDKTSLENLYNLLSQFRESLNFQKKNMLDLKKEAIDLINLLSKEYHLD